MPKPLSIKIGQKFNKWTILNEELRHLQPNGKLCRMFLCKCNCGTIKTVSLTSLITEKSKSCGCYMKEVNGKRIGKMSMTHGSTTLKENEFKSLYFVWNTIKQRCNNPNNDKFTNYGGRGIKICEEWKNDFFKFKEWSINNGYYKQNTNIPFKNKLSIDRIDNNGDYCPENCRWITISENTKKKKYDKNKRQSSKSF